MEQQKRVDGEVGEEGAPMMPADETRLRHVRSRDGTEIAYWVSGDGQPLVLVHGVLSDHTRWQPLLPYLEPYATVYAIDRRGRGASGDGQSYRAVREFEDIAAVVDAVAESSGSQATLYGHSHGGFCAFGAAMLTSNIGRLALYEGWPHPTPEVFALPSDVEQRLEALLAEGRPEPAVEMFVREVLMAPVDELMAMRTQPSWPARVAAAPTLVREMRAAVDEGTFDGRQAATITVPTLLLVGEHSTDPSKTQVGVVAAALPDARVEVLAGQSHLADVLAPEVVAEHLLAFLQDDHA